MTPEDLHFLSELNLPPKKQRVESFKKYWLIFISEKYDVELRDNGSYSFFVPKWGRVDYYPKADKLLKRHQNEWYYHGLRMIFNTLKVDYDR